MLRLQGDSNGCGVSSDSTWQGLAMIDLQPWNNSAIVAGCRAIGTAYETGSGNRFTVDSKVHLSLAGIEGGVNIQGTLTAVIARNLPIPENQGKTSAGLRTYVITPCGTSE